MMGLRQSREKIALEKQALATKWFKIDSASYLFFLRTFLFFGENY
jgi:hypothetical protein